MNHVQTRQRQSRLVAVLDAPARMLQPGIFQPRQTRARAAAAVASIKSLVTLTGSTRGKPSMRHSMSTTASVAIPDENAWSAVTTSTFCGGTYS